VNKVFLLGNVGKDPEIKATGGGTVVANFGLATSERFKDQQGNFQERTEWHNVVAYGRVGEIVRDYVKKGNKLFIEGRINTRNWDDKEHPGRKVYRTEIIVNDLSLLSGPRRWRGGRRRIEPRGEFDGELRSASADQRRRLLAVGRDLRRRYSVLVLSRFLSCPARLLPRSTHP
jgi:single-strand DNA-binding protein